MSFAVKKQVVLTLLEIKSNFHQSLDSIYGTDEVTSLFFLSIEYYLNLSRTDYAFNKDYSITQEQKEELLNLLNQLKKEIPIQYILEETAFFGMNFKVTPDVLIPRQETEELVDWVLKSTKLKVGSTKFEVGNLKYEVGSEKCKVSKFSDLNSSSSSDSNSKLKILDIGTGSGCIAISLAKHLPNAEIFALDISKKALKVAQHNAQNNNVDITFIKADILSENIFEHSVLKDIKFDIIVSNPPYVRHLEKVEIKPNVLEHEPHLALFVADEDPLIFYRAISNFARQKLKDQGLLFFEVNQYLGEDTVELIKAKAFKTIELRTDLNGNERMVKALL